ncbi:hypothetical protein CFIMG_007595RA00001 [Ceratocystis fimbriata CBS 114723]|uniref:Uncharacterized protein n=1 Tax=Ceratocystis fimbriata CBS 114723 TaxID=1035309 RepID=A0A2C5WV44_9PEZI|nr:hypothetical protein CFIMG_007595RA00001 [Ceratocystis fimbriata CBS 114723]
MWLGLLHPDISLCRAVPVTQTETSIYVSGSNKSYHAVQLNSGNATARSIEASYLTTSSSGKMRGK